MGRKATEGLTALFHAAEKAGDLRKAWEKSQVTTWGNAQRQFKAWQQHRLQLQQQQSAVAVMASPTPAAGAGGSAAPAIVRKRKADAAGRTTEPVGKKSRKTSLQVETDVANQVKWSADHEKQRKAAVKRASELRRAGTLGKKGHTLSDVAREFSSKLATDNPKEITVDSLKHWYARGRNSSSGKRKRGPPQHPVREALTAVAKSYARLSQLNGKSIMPSELLLKMQASLACTPMYAEMLDGEASQRKILKRLREGEDALNSEEGESICMRRIEALTVENVQLFFDSWDKVLLDNQFAVMRYNEEEDRMMPYISKQKRRRIIATDETQTVGSTELEKGGPRARVYVDKTIGLAELAALNE